MHILLVNKCRIPVFAYGGTERVMWDLGWELTQLGHKVTYLVNPGSHCDFAEVKIFDKKAPHLPQIPRDVDVVHFQFKPNFDPDDGFDIPYIMTEHGNPGAHSTNLHNTVYVSKNHAARNHSDQYVYNGLNWAPYGPVDFERRREYFHFLAKAHWNVKNLKGSIDVAVDARVKLAVLGGNRISFSRGFRFTLTPWARFHGMVGGQKKSTLLNGSNGQIFPVRWDEPFGLAMIESLYFGCPVFGTPYGSLPELIGEDVGVLSTSKAELVDAVRSRRFDPRACHAYARDTYNSRKMALDYLRTYERVIAGEKLNATKPFMGEYSKDLLPWGD